MLQLKSKLLSKTGFQDNEYLDKYVCLIERNRRPNLYGKSMNKHHIVPRAWFKLMNLPVDDTLPNLVKLPYREHVLAHYYLCLCTTDKLQYANQLALVLLVSRKNLDYSEKLLVKGLPLYNNIYEDYLKKKSSSYKLYTES